MKFQFSTFLGSVLINLLLIPQLYKCQYLIHDFDSITVIIKLAKVFPTVSVGEKSSLLSKSTSEIISTQTACILTIFLTDRGSLFF
jgi:hypothetical protein